MLTLYDQALTDSEFKSVQSLIYDLAGIALADSKHIMVQSRLVKRLRALQLDSYAEYLKFLKVPCNKSEITNFINALTTNKTDFFRESHHFDFLAKTVFPEIQRRAEDGGKRQLRIWCSASSTGEEPYTIAMSIREFFGTDARWDIRVLASDIDTDVLSAADKGIYAPEKFADMSPELIRKYFVRESRAPDSNYRVKPVLRDLITFRQVNLQDAKWQINTSFDVVFCRNVMIYFNSESQRKIIAHIAEYLKPEGYLFVGHSESLFGLSDGFKPLGDTIYGLKANQSDCNAASKPSVQRPIVPSTRSLSAREASKPKSPPSTVVNRTTLASEVKQSIIVGEVHASSQPMWITTLLGSCVAVCLYDEKTRVGGMNHFMLPGPRESEGTSASYGVHSMELLINAIMRHGGDRRALKAKVFGGGNVLQSTARSLRDIGAANVEFAQHFLRTERIPIVAAHTLQDAGMHIQFHTHTAKVLLRMLSQRDSEVVERDGARKATSALRKLDTSSITLFNDNGGQI